jgi:cytochrome c-type biogenesis protein CcmE
MKKRRLKKWVKVTLGIMITCIIWLLIIFALAKRVEFFDNNLQQCGNNYCEK